MYVYERHKQIMKNHEKIYTNAFADYDCSGCGCFL